MNSLVLSSFSLYLAAPGSMQDLYSPTRDWTHNPLHWERGILTTGLPGKSQQPCFTDEKTEVYRNDDVFWAPSDGTRTQSASFDFKSSNLSILWYHLVFLSSRCFSDSLENLGRYNCKWNLHLYPCLPHCTRKRWMTKCLGAFICLTALLLSPVLFLVISHNWLLHPQHLHLSLARDDI